MNENKRFYWIKLKTNFFNLDEIDFLLSQDNGCKYIVLYQMLCLNTANNGGEMSTRIGEMIVPYDVEKIARDTKYFDVDTVIVALGGLRDRSPAPPRRRACRQRRKPPSASRPPHRWGNEWRQASRRPRPASPTPPSPRRSQGCKWSGWARQTGRIRRKYRGEWGRPPRSTPPDQCTSARADPAERCRE